MVLDVCWCVYVLFFPHNVFKISDLWHEGSVGENNLINNEQPRSVNDGTIFLFDGVNHTT